MITNQNHMTGENKKRSFLRITDIYRTGTLLLCLFYNCLFNPLEYLFGEKTAIANCQLSTIHAQTIKGKATFYSKRATGSRTANGERLHHDSLTCAHRTFPFNTMLRVKNPANGREVVVRVTDRGPFIRGRIIDLSWRAAKELGIIAQGVAMVEVENLGKAGKPIIMKNEEEDQEKNRLPDFEFDITGAGYSFIDEWKERQQTTKKLPEGKNEKKEDATEWSDVFDRLEYLHR
jgi:rare lipoprotein A